MTSFNLHYAKQWVKTSDSASARFLKQCWLATKQLEVPNIPVLFKVLYHLHLSVKHVLGELLRVLYYTPIFKARLANKPKQLFLYGGLPAVIGSFDFIMGDKVRLAAKTTISGRTVMGSNPKLVVGNNVGIGWGTSISVGRNIVIGENARIAGDCYLAGYPGHPINAKDRALGLPDTEAQVGDIILGDDVWLGTGVKVMPNVTIGKGTIVGAGSVVTKDLPANVLAGGCPAKVIRSLEE